MYRGPLRRDDTAAHTTYGYMRRIDTVTGRYIGKTAQNQHHKQRSNFESFLVLGVPRWPMGSSLLGMEMSLLHM